MSATRGASQLANRRLRNQRLSGAPLRDVAEVVRWLGAMQSQEYALARWSIGQRGTGMRESDVDRALAEARIVRTHVLRDTWHFVAAEDFRWLVELTRPRIRARNETMHRQLEIDGRFLARTDRMLVEAIREHGPMSRNELEPQLRARRIEARGLRLGYMLMHAELEMLICSGPMRRGRPVYALVEGRVPMDGQLPRDEALARLGKRYFTSHGPATLRDFAWWASLRVADATRSVDLLGAELHSAEIDGRTYWSPRDEPRAPRRSGAFLLQGYDEYVIAYSESRDVLDAEHLAGVVPRGRSMFTHAVVIDGQVIGHWRRAVVRDEVVIEMQLARAVTRAEREQLDQEVERYGRFAGLRARWTHV